MLPPPLPRDWPYAPRPALGLAADREVALPGLPGLWTLRGDPELALSGGPEPLGGAFGRGGVFRVGPVVLRPYRRGGMVRHWVADRYVSPGRFLREYQVHRALWEAGFPTVKPLGVAWQGAGLGVRGVCLTTFAPGRPWPRAWDSELPPGLAQAIRALVAWGLWSPDLNATNVHLLEEGSLALLDWDRADWNSSPDLARRYRDRLHRSLQRLDAPTSLLEGLDSL